MMRYEHITDPKALRERENKEALIMQNVANIDYIAMMSDIEIPTDEEGAEDESEV